MNELYVKFLPAEDWEQFAQLIGYSVSGAGDLSCVSDDAYYEVEKQAEAIVPTVKAPT